LLNNWQTLKNQEAALPPRSTLTGFPRRILMKLSLIALCMLTAVGFIASNTRADQPAVTNAGEAKFKEQCAVCHVNGGNIINPQKTLLKNDRKANNITSAADIINKMRKPGPGMTLFDEKTISNNDAQAIAEYILKTF
jgi:cytochrome c6